MSLKKSQRLILAVNVLSLILFSIIFVKMKNYEFLMYIGAISLLLLIIASTNKKMGYPDGLLWGLTAFSLLHMSGGAIFVGGRVLYDVMILQIVAEPYRIFKFDQFVHMFGAWLATLVIFHILKPRIKEGNKRWLVLGIVVVAAGLGAGALNEIVEFIVDIIVPKTGVGGYENTLLDLISCLIGAVGAMLYLLARKRLG